MQETPIGTHIGRYEVLATLGRGAMGVVYQARDPQIDRLVAIKTILWMGDDTDARDYRQRFMQEAKAAGRLSHPGIVQVFDVGEDAESKLPFIVMEYVAGQSLNKVLAGLPGAKMLLEDALRLAQEIAEALAYAHAQGVVHRDIKPSNILVTDDGHAKIADFGVAKLDFANLTMAGHAVGTPAYMAPEQLAGEHVDGRADLFSLGVILYSMVAGFRPFQGRGNSTIAHKVRHGEPLPVTAFDVKLPAEIDALIAHAMAKDAAQRFQSGAEMAAAIRRLRGSGAISTGSTDVSSVMQETGEHVACMARGSTSKVQVHAQAAAKPATTGRRDATTGAKQVAKADAARRSSRPVLSSRGALAIALTVALAAASVLAWRLHSSMRPQAQAEPVAWETAPASTASAPAESSKLDLETVPQVQAHAGEVPSALKSTTAVKNAKPKARAQQGVSVEDRTKLLTKVATQAAPPQVATKPAVNESATLQLALEHAFEAAQVTVWVGDQQLLNEDLRGEKKRTLMFQRTRGTFMNKVAVPLGQHLVRVRVQSSVDAFDASQSVNGDFSKAAQYVLHARCDKRRKELKLALEAVSVSSSVENAGR